MPTLKEYLEQILETGWKLGFDGRLVQAGEAQAYEQITQKKQGGIILTGIWHRRSGRKDRP